MAVLIESMSDASHDGWVQPDAIARGIPPDASADLVFHGGKSCG
jgi:hypothetical protein